MVTLKTVFTNALLAALAVAAPLEDALLVKESLVKRTNPSIEPAFNEQQKTQISDGFKNALELATYAILAMDYPNRRGIFNKYFNEADRDVVRKVFLQILGNPSDLGDSDPTGSDTLGAISIRKDFPDHEGKIICVDNTWIAAMRGWETDNPVVVICPIAFKHGGIGLGYDNAEKVNCDYIGDRVTWRMDTMGSTILHEYTHFKKLVAPPLNDATDDLDDGYGCVGTRNLNKNGATNNADSYTWYANEALWSILCNKDYGDPQPGDGDDPNCGNTVCHDGTSTAG